MGPLRDYKYVLSCVFFCFIIVQCSNLVDKCFKYKYFFSQVPRGSLVAVVGSVGAGKSSLCGALLGDMEKLSGSVNVNVSLSAFL